jgi:hypothetical protein
MLFQDRHTLSRGLTIGMVVLHGAPVRLADGEAKLLVSHGSTSPDGRWSRFFCALPPRRLLLFQLWRTDVKRLSASVYRVLEG